MMDTVENIAIIAMTIMLMGLAVIVLFAALYIGRIIVHELMDDLKDKE